MKALWRRLRGSKDVRGAVAAQERADEPDRSEWLEAWRDASDIARRRSAEVRSDLSYGPSGSERLDLYLPVHRPRRLPFAAFVGGIGWRPRDKADLGFPAKAMHRRGAAFVAIGFDGAPPADLETQADQVRRAWSFLIENAEHLGLDANRGHLIGHSSGAHLAALTALDPQAPPPLSAVLLSGCYDLEPMLRSAPDDSLGLRADNVARLSPLRSLRRTDTEIVVAWGQHESDAIRRQSHAFAHACRSRGLSVKQGELPGRMHLDTSLELADPHSRTLETIGERGPATANTPTR